MTAPVRFEDSVTLNGQALELTIPPSRTSD